MYRHAGGVGNGGGLLAVAAAVDALKLIKMRRAKEMRAPPKDIKRKGWGRAALTLVRMKVLCQTSSLAPGAWFAGSGFVTELAAAARV